MATSSMTVNSKKDYLEHLYGENVNIVNNPYLLSHLGNLCKASTKQPAINLIVTNLYRALIQEVLNYEFPLKSETIRTRMADLDQRGFWQGNVIDPEQRTITVDIARAGTLPSEACFETLNYILNPENVRQDHVFMSRKTDSENKVIGSDWSGSKIGGDIQDAIVMFPDPMGATGGSIASAISYYKDSVEGVARKYISINLIITPEFIQKVKKAHPDAVIYAIRLDRGASFQEVLESIPGTYPEKESGLTDTHYIIPGGGGFGEIMNNSYC